MSAHFEDVITQSNKTEAYLEALCQILHFSTDGISGDPKHFDLEMWMCGFVTTEGLWALVNATPEQKFRAFQIAMGYDK